MNCLEYRQICGADPGHGATDFRDHETECKDCRAYAREMRVLDQRIREALAFDVPITVRRPQAAAVQSEVRRWRPARLGIAASLFAAIGLSVGVWLSAPPPALADAVTGHLKHERKAWQPTDNPVAAEVLDAVLQHADVQMKGNVGLISYARTCSIRGNDVPHLMIQGERGPVMVLIMRNEKVDEAVPLRAKGYEGLIVPVGEGSIAIVGREGEPMAPLSDKISQSVYWRL